MAHGTGIEWTESTWNPLTGCTKISPGCKNCYAERMSHRLKAMGQINYVNGFALTIHENLLYRPLHWKKSQMIFVNSMSDLFHRDVPTEFIIRVFDIMRMASWHTFQVLTKRSHRLLELDKIIDWPPNVWMGVTVENSSYLYRIDHLRHTSAYTKFISMEPLLGNFSELNLFNLDWVIVGGESGPGARPIQEEWIISIKDSCVNQKVPFFFKQWGGVQKKKNGRILQGRTWDELPNFLHIDA